MPSPSPFSLFAATLCFFHLSEFALAFAFQRDSLGLHSAQLAAREAERTRSHLPRAGFLFSKPYVGAMSFACLEHAVELRLVPWLKARAARRRRCTCVSDTSVRSQALPPSGARSVWDSLCLGRVSGSWEWRRLVAHSRTLSPSV
jgi:hypothetical protein